MPPPRVIILDFDETIADSSEARRMALTQTAEEYLGVVTTAAEVAEMLHRFPTLEEQMLHLAGDEGLAAKMVWRYRELAYRERRQPFDLYPGIRETITSLRDQGTRLGLVTSRYRYRQERGLTWGVLPELERLGLLSLFSAVVGYEDTEDHKPSAAPFLRCLELLQEEAAEVIGVGDSPSDIKGARTAGMLTAGALWGILDRTVLLDEKPNWVLESPEELLHLQLPLRQE